VRPRVSVLLCQSKVDYVTTICIFGRSHKEVVRLYVSVYEILFMEEFHSPYLIFGKDTITGPVRIGISGHYSCMFGANRNVPVDRLA
jgi:hypothetical protein